MNSSRDGRVEEVNRRYADVVELHKAVVEKSLANRLANSPRSRVAFGALSFLEKIREIGVKWFSLRSHIQGHAHLGKPERLPPSSLLPSRQRNDII